MKIRVLAGAAALTLLALVGCASTTPPAGNAAKNRADPWERWNRGVYTFNEKLDENVLKPTATAYAKVVPRPVRRGVTNFFNNISDAWSAVNNFAQGKGANGFQDVTRVAVNTVFGLGGLFDIASEAGLDRQGEDFGQTLGRWGVPSGPYVVWPLLGPSTVRDSAALPVDRSVSAALLTKDDGARFALIALQVIDTRANLLQASNMLNDIALDKYVFVRDAYLQRRRSLVYDGNAPADDDEVPFEREKPEAPAAPASSASQAGQ